VLKVENQAEKLLGQSGLYMKEILYLLPVQGSDTNWYRNVLVDPTLKISVDGVEITAKGKPITDSNRVDDIVRKFKSKYGEGQIKKYYLKLDVAAEVSLIH